MRGCREEENEEKLANKQVSESTVPQTIDLAKKSKKRKHLPKHGTIYKAVKVIFKMTFTPFDEQHYIKLVFLMLLTSRGVFPPHSGMRTAQTTPMVAYGPPPADHPTMAPNTPK